MLEYKRLLLPCEYVFTSTQSFLHVLFNVELNFE